MPSKSDPCDADAPPPYDDVQHTPRNSDWKTSSEQPESTIAATRIQRIQNTTHTVLAPLIATQISTCTSKALYILIPASTLHHHPHPKDIANIPASLSAHQLALVSPPEPSTSTSTSPDSFWHQPAVADALTSALRIHLTHLGHVVEQGSTPGATSPSSAGPPRRQPLLTRLFSDDPHAPSRHFKTGWRSADEDSTCTPSPVRDQMRIIASIRDTSVNVETPLGLWETATFPTMWIMIEIGT